MNVVKNEMNGTKKDAQVIVKLGQHITEDSLIYLLDLMEELNKEEKAILRSVLKGLPMYEIEQERFHEFYHQEG